MASLNVRDLGDFIRDQRGAAQLSLRQLARQAGVSNPYLSQIERGLRKPSAEILQQIAKALRISAEALYVQAGFLEERPGDSEVVGAVLRDENLTERQRQVILEIYEAFRGENATAAATAAVPSPTAPASTAQATAGPPKPAPARSAARKPAAAKAGPKTTAPKTTAPKTTAPKTTAPKSTVTKATAPKTTAPKSTVTKATAPKSTVTKATTPKSAASTAVTPKARSPRTAVS